MRTAPLKRWDLVAVPSTVGSRNTACRECYHWVTVFGLWPLAFGLWCLNFAFVFFPKVVRRNHSVKRRCVKDLRPKTKGQRPKADQQQMSAHKPQKVTTFHSLDTALQRT